MYLFTILYLFTCYADISHGKVKEKCCDFNERLEFENFNYKCVNDTTNRLGVRSQSVGFLNKNVDGSCVDSVGTTNFVALNIISGQIQQADPTGDEYFPKCCPLGYFYNSTRHSCMKNISLRHDFIKEDFVKVGLPHCKLIVDRKVDVSDIEASRLNSCVDEDESGDYIKRSCRDDTEICRNIRCVKKCCPDGQSFVNGAHCFDTYINGLDLSFSSTIEEPEAPFAVISNRTCKRIYLMSERRFIFTLERNGTFRYWQNTTNSYMYEDIDSPFPYCIEHSERKGAQGFFFFKCYVERPYLAKFQYTLWPKVLSCIFLAVTIILYIILNETRNLFGKILINYCIATLILFALLIYAQVNLEPADADCRLIGYTLIFVSTVSFAWLNIMCCDIWFTFGSTKQSIGAHQRRKDLKKLLIYLFCGWGLPACLTLTIFLFSLSHFLPESVHPFIGYSMCFIENRNYAPILFLRLPHLIIQLANMVLFFKTIIYCLRIKDEINKINDTTRSDRFNKDKERLFLIIKLSIIMGVTFVFDTISGFVKMSEMGEVPKYIEIIWDCLNCLQGVFIFIIFICKKKTYQGILKKLHLSKKKQPQVSMSSTRMSLLSSSSKNGRTSLKVGTIPG